MVLTPSSNKNNMTDDIEIKNSIGRKTGVEDDTLWTHSDEKGKKNCPTKS